MRKFFLIICISNFSSEKGSRSGFGSRKISNICGWYVVYLFPKKINKLEQLIWRFFFISAAAIYMAVQASVDKKTQREISDIAGVAEVTIKQSYKLMIPRAAELFPENFKFDTPIDQLPAS